ncbi:MAG TPA: BlaI/MecI/CopY family transcriptional regulator [Sumerlaeia bacterium]|nr:BlaI/MecI/CopY family transcriptional regulator [Sumerlaeia bacterium]
MGKRSYLNLSRRERQIMEIIYREGRASVAEVREAMPDAPSYSAVRALLALLEEKGHLRHRREGRKYVYSPTVPRNRACRSALRNLLHTFFDGSIEHAVASLIDLKAGDLSDEDLERLSKRIEEARRKGG